MLTPNQKNCKGMTSVSVNFVKSRQVFLLFFFLQSLSHTQKEQTQ